MKKKLIVLCILLLTGIFAISCSNDTVDSDDGIDVDLSVLSTTMAQAEYENIISNSEKYIGKIIRATGTYYSFSNESTGDYYHFVIIIQGDSCCQMGFEFKLDGDYSAPNDYPEENKIIEVTGTLKMADDRGFPYLFLASGEMTVLG